MLAGAIGLASEIKIWAFLEVGQWFGYLGVVDGDRYKAWLECLAVILELKGFLCS